MMTTYALYQTNQNLKGSVYQMKRVNRIMNLIQNGLKMNSLLALKASSKAPKNYVSFWALILQQPQSILRLLPSMPLVSF
jgi:hypothetical protein